MNENGLACCCRRGATRGGRGCWLLVLLPLGVSAAVEDFSFGLWAARIIENRDRRNVLLEALVDAPLDEVQNTPRRMYMGVPHAVRRSWGGSTRATNGDPSGKRSIE
jgi:hypothetical protein